jgi:hypothetical protein
VALSIPRNTTKLSPSTLLSYHFGKELPLLKRVLPGPFRPVPPCSADFPKGLQATRSPTGASSLVPLGRLVVAHSPATACARGAQQKDAPALSM